MLNPSYSGGPNLGYEPADLPNVSNINPTFSDYLGMFTRTFAGPVSSLLSSSSKKKDAPEAPMTRAPQGRQTAYMRPGSLGAATPFQPVFPMPEYQQMSQQAFRDALINYILSNPGKNIQGLL